jgi:hypothetical protein
MPQGTPRAKSYVPSGCGGIFYIMFMTTATIEIKKDIALELLQYLENIDILRVLDKNNVVEKKKTLGDFFGVLPEETCEALKEHTQKARNEWNRVF